MMRVRSAVALGFAWLVMVVPGPARAQSDDCSQEIRFGKPRRFAWEFSPFVGGSLYDQSSDSLAFENQAGLGARIGFNWTRHWETELTYELVPDLRTVDHVLENITAQYMDLNMVFNMNTSEKQYQNFGRWISSDKWTPYFTFGVGRGDFDFDDRDSDEEFTFNGGLGTRIMLGRVAGVRFDARVRSLPDQNIVEFSPSMGLSLIMGGKALRDSDADGVLDPDDRCPGTPQGCEVDCFGCPYDQDGDGVCDGLDKCPDTPPGCYVDADGCPLDSDGDGVCDGLDVEDTPPGCWVDATGKSRDTDGDGVCDGVDRCPNTPEGCRVDRFGCPLDSDADGVCDGRDECPGTPPGTRVDERGCPVLRLVLADVYFEFNKAVIRDFYYPFLDEVARSLKADNNLSVVMELEGHTDAVGSVHYNYQLGERRAKAVNEYLVSKGIPPNRLVISSRGETEPIASNATAEGRRHNRRVEMHPHGPKIDPSQIKEYKIVLRDIFFDTDRAELRDEFKPFLREVATAMSEARFSDVPVVLEGHADYRSSDAHNMELSRRRAESVKQFLVSQGLPASRVNLRPQGERGATGRGAQGMRQDRRVEVHSR